MAGFIAFGALVILGMMHNARKRHDSDVAERIAKHKAEQAKHDADKALAEYETAKLTNPAPARGRPRKTTD
jgi:hypothetical protein